MSMCEAADPMCLFLQAFRNGMRLIRYNKRQTNLVNHSKILEPRDYTTSSSGVLIPVIIVVVIIKLIVFSILLHRYLKRRERKKARELERQQQENSLLPPPPYAAQPAPTASKHAFQCPGSHSPGSTCSNCRALDTTVVGVTAREPSTTSPALPCHRQHVAGIPCSTCGSNTPTDHLKVAPTPSSAKGTSASKRKCHTLHLPWKKCPTCRVDPPRIGHIELDSEPLPPGPHEMQAHVPAWQGQPTQRTENYGGFYGPESGGSDARWLRRPEVPNQTLVSLQGRHENTTALITSPVAVVNVAAPVSPPSRRTLVVGDGHKSYVSYQAASGQAVRHPRTRSVSPIDEGRLRSGVGSPRRSEGGAPSIEGNEAVDVEVGRREGHKRNKSSEGLLSRYIGT